MGHPDVSTSCAGLNFPQSHNSYHTLRLSNYNVYLFLRLDDGVFLVAYLKSLAIIFRKLYPYVDYWYWVLSGIINCFFKVKTTISIVIAAFD